MRIASFNVNSIRTRLDLVLDYLAQEQPLALGLQETKVVDEDFPLEPLGNLGYEVHPFGQKSYNGVALLTQGKVLALQQGFDNEDPAAQKRFQALQLDCQLGHLTLINGYFPQGESREHPTKFPAKQKFYRDLLGYLQQHHQPQDKLLVMGDFNVAPADLDVGIGPDNAKRWLKTGKCAFLPEEREWLQALAAWGLVDSFRHLHPESQAMSWFDYRTNGYADGRGLRIDQIWVSRGLLPHLRGAGIDYRLRQAERPSDHCLIWADFSP